MGVMVVVVVLVVMDMVAVVRHAIARILRKIYLMSARIKS
jgi:hypothetical protein